MFHIKLIEMKSTMIFAVMLTIMLASGAGKAQTNYGNNDYRIYAGSNVGLSLINMVFKSVEYADEPGWNTRIIPPVQFSVDYRLHKRVSVGGAFAVSKVWVDYLSTATPVSPEPDGLISQFAGDLLRLNAGVRGLFYYMARERIDMYGGLKVGLNYWALKTSSADPDFGVTGDPFSMVDAGFFPAFQIIPFGMTVYPVENFGINFEFAAGQPYFMSLGFKARF